MFYYIEHVIALVPMKGNIPILFQSVHLVKMLLYVPQILST